MASVNNRVVVTRNNDDTVVKQLYGNYIDQMKQRDYQRNTTDEPDTYIPMPGTSTFRGSRPVMNSKKNPNAEPEGAPANIVFHAIQDHPELTDPRNRKPVNAIPMTAFDMPTNIINHADPNALSVAPTPPTQESISKEMENMRYQAMPMQPFCPGYNPAQSQVDGPTVISRPRQFNAEPVYPDAHTRPDPGFPQDDILPPVTHETVQPTEDMIVKVLGYNESNMDLLTKVSENTARCSKILKKINNTSVPIDVKEIMHVLQFMDNSEFRKVLSTAFEKTLMKNQELYAKITSYLNGTAVIEDDTKTDDSSNTSSGADADSTKNLDDNKSTSDSSDDTKTDTSTDTEKDSSSLDSDTPSTTGSESQGSDASGSSAS